MFSVLFVTSLNETRSVYLHQVFHYSTFRLHECLGWCFSSQYSVVMIVVITCEIVGLADRERHKL